MKLLLLALFATAIAMTEASPQTLAIDARFSGSWFQPERDGEGWILQILPDGNAAVFWFTYPPSGSPGEQTWIVGQDAVVEGSTIRFGTVFTTRGARFGDAFVADDLVIEPWGELEMEFADCNHGNVRYSGPEAFGSAERAIVRLTALDGHACDAAAPKLLQSAHSGAWFQPDRSGEGWLVELLSDDVGVVYWFSYDPDGGQAWFIGVGRREGDAVVLTDMLRPVGTRFGEAFDPEAIERTHWGTFAMTFTGCDDALLRFDSAQAGWDSQVRRPLRLTGIAGANCQPPATSAQASGQWSGAPALPMALSEVAYTDHRDRAYVIGGPAAFEYDPASQAWRQLADPPAPRDHAMAAGFGDSIFVFGGFVARQFQATASVWRLDLASNTWEVLPDMPFALAAGSAATLNNRIYVTGNSTLLMEFDPLSRTWRQAGFTPSQRDHAQLVAFRGELWHLAGRSGSFLFRSVDIFDPASSTWRAGPPLASGRSGFAAAVAADQLMVAGGEGLVDAAPGMPSAFLVGSFELLASEEEGWRFGPAMPKATHGLAGAGIRGRLHLIAGSEIAGSLDGSVTVHSVYTPE